MNKLILSMSFLLVSSFSNSSFGQNQKFTSEDSLAIRKSSHDFEVAFNAHDAKAFASLFLVKAEFTNVVGQSATGRKEIEEFHAPMFEGKPGYYSFKSSTLKIGVPKISVIRPDIASVDVFWTMDKCLLPNGAELNNRRGLITFLMVKENGKWGIDIMHNADLPPSDNK